MAGELEDEGKGNLELKTDRPAPFKNSGNSQIYPGHKFLLKVFTAAKEVSSHEPGTKIKANTLKGSIGAKAVAQADIIKFHEPDFNWSISVTVGNSRFNLVIDSIDTAQSISSPIERSSDSEIDVLRSVCRTGRLSANKDWLSNAVYQPLPKTDE